MKLLTFLFDAVPSFALVCPLRYVRHNEATQAWAPDVDSITNVIINAVPSQHGLVELLPTGFSTTHATLRFFMNSR